MADKKGIVLYLDYRKHIELLSYKERGQLLTAILDYADTGKIPTFDGALQMCFSFIRLQLDRDNEKYLEKCRKNQENGRKGGRPKKQTETEKSKRFSAEAKKADTDTETETETDKDTETSTNNKKKSFIPPTIEEVSSYCIERGNSVDAESFINFYSSKGWMVGKNKMKDWKAAVRTWERNANGTERGVKRNGTNAEISRTQRENFNDFGF